jgi:hypothetical protein
MSLIWGRNGTVTYNLDKYVARSEAITAVQLRIQVFVRPVHSKFVSDCGMEDAQHETQFYELGDGFMQFFPQL